MGKHELFIGDSRNMDKVRTKSVHLIVTSPPYYDLKDYGVEGQIGFGESPDEYRKSLRQVWSECNRTLIPGRKMCVVVGDVFKSDERGYRIIPIHAHIIEDCVAFGFDYLGCILWNKMTTMNTSGEGKVMGSYPYPFNGVVRQDHEYILIFRKRSERKRPTAGMAKEKEMSRISRKDWGEWFKSSWSVPGERQGEHPAMFPVEIPIRLIRMFSFFGETVLDPFMGSGTTALAADITGRDSIGYEMNGDFEKLWWDKVFGNSTYVYPPSFDTIKTDKKDDHYVMEKKARRTGESVSRTKPALDDKEYKEPRNIVEGQYMIAEMMGGKKGDDIPMVESNGLLVPARYAKPRTDDREMESTCEFKLGNHRGCEDRYKYEVSMAMGALGIRKSEDKLTDEEWTLINDRIAGFHVRDVVSGPHADETGREKERIAKELKDKYGWDF